MLQGIKNINSQSLKKVLRLFRFIKPYSGTYLIGMVMLVFSTLTTLVFPILIGEVTKVLEGKSEFSLNHVAGIFALVLVLQAIFSFFRIFLFSNVSEYATADIRQMVYKKMVSSPITFFENNRVGDLISRLTSDVSAIQNVLTTTVAEFFRQIVTLVLGIGYLIFLSWKLSLLILITLPVTVVSAVVFGRFVRRIAKEVQTKLAEANVVVDESFQSIATVKAYTNERLEYDRYSGLVKEVVRMSVRLAKYRGLFASFFTIGLFGGICLVVWYGGTLIQNNELALSELITFLMLSMFIAGSLGGMSEIYTSLQRTVGASERILEILDEPSEVEIDFRGEERKLNGAVTFKEVNFSYPSRKEAKVLKDVSFTISAGEKVALVGHSGAGKSTVVQLLMRFYEIESGSIEIDGMADLDIPLIRKNIAIVPQEVLLFGGSIYDNILYGNPHSTKDEVYEAARKANTLEFIEKFPEGFNTLVGERGVKLSGGQKQRIAIARAILKNPAILILDEATSALDSHTESLIQEALSELMKGRTSIIIAHRLATIKNVDNILVFNDGKIVESGTHESLLLNPEGVYSQLVKLQIDALLLKN